MSSSPATVSWNSTESDAAGDMHNTNIYTYINIYIHTYIHTFTNVTVPQFVQDFHISNTLTDY